MVPNPLLEKKSINPNILIELARALAKPYNDFVEDYVSKHPDAKGLSYEAIIKMENSGKPVVWNSITIYPESYKGNETYISSDTKSEEQHKIGRRAAEVKRWLNKENRKQDEVSEVINHPYNPFSWIPGVRTAVNMGISNAAHRTNNPNKYSYDLNTGISLATDIPMLKWGMGGLKPFVGSYTGTVAGGLVGELFDSPNLGAFIGGVAGGFSPKLVSKGANYVYTKLAPKDWQIARSINKSLYDLPLPSYTTEYTPFNWRYRLGDVEINDPNLNFRQGASGTVNDFLQSGKVRVKYEGKAKKDRTKAPGKFLLTKEFNNPMFKQGGLWYDGWLINEAGSNPNYSDLLVTRLPLKFATKSSGSAKFDQGGRRIPFNENLLNIDNTSAFVWKNGYGFRRIRPEKELILDFTKDLQN